jgi:hypothetical protein
LRSDGNGLQLSGGLNAILIFFFIDAQNFVFRSKVSSCPNLLLG